MKSALADCRLEWTLQTRYWACILGGAIGDCLGFPYEGRKGPLAIDEKSPWELSDDTQLTLATCEAITKSGTVEAAAIAETLADGFRRSRFRGLGASTYKALSELSVGGHWALVGRKGEMAAGNGAAMRIAPLAFCLDPASDSARRTIRDVCRITHHNEEAYVGALAVVVAVREAWKGRWTGGPGLLGLVRDQLPDSSVRDRFAAIAELDDDQSAASVATRFGCSGYVVESVPFALFGAQAAGVLSFQETLLRLVRCGGDTDTIASIAGQVAGTLFGRGGIPEPLIERLPEDENVLAIASRFAESLVK